MHIQIINYRGIAAASLDLSKICLIAGPNEAGKTSISQATAAALTGDAIPIHGIKKTQAGMLVRSGTASGSSAITTDTGSTTVTWPNAKVKSEGAMPFASRFATGLQSIVNLDDKSRIEVLTDYLKATPVRADLDAALTSLELPDSVLAKLWELIQQAGWDGCHAQIKEKGARLKGQWQQITGEQYGSKKAESWIPADYEAGLEGQSEDKLKAIVTDARDALESAIAADAVDDSRRGDLEALAALKPERSMALTTAKLAAADPALAEQLKQAQGFVADISAKRDAITDELKNLPAITQGAGVPCPHCDTVLRISGQTLSLAAVIDPAEIADRAAAIAEVQARLDTTNDAIAKHMSAVSEIQSKINADNAARTAAITEATRLLTECDRAETELKKPVPTFSGPSLDECRTTLAAAEKRLAAFIAKTGADDKHMNIGKNQELLEKIAPEGVRNDVLVKALTAFNESLLPITKAASWHTVTLDTDLSPLYGGTPYLLLSESAKFRVRTALSIGMAKLDGSQALIVDAADILDKAGRNGLFKAVRATGLPCLIAMTMDSKDLVPKLGALGASYWINSEATAELV